MEKKEVINLTKKTNLSREKKYRQLYIVQDDHLVSKKSKIMESDLRLQIEKLEAKLKHYRRDNE